MEGSHVAQRDAPDMTDDNQAEDGTPSRGTRGPGNGDDATRSLGSMEAARVAAKDVLELTGRNPEHVVSVAKHDDSWHVGLEVVELHRIPDSADILAIYEVTLDARGELVTCRRGRRYLRGSTEERG